MLKILSHCYLLLWVVSVLYGVAYFVSDVQADERHYLTMQFLTAIAAWCWEKDTEKRYG